MFQRRLISSLNSIPLRSTNFNKISRVFASSSSSQLTAFEERWNKLTQAEKELVAKEYEHLQKGDWKSLTVDQKRIRKRMEYIVD